MTKSSLRKAMGAIKHEDYVHRKMDSVPFPPKLTQSEPPWLEWEQDFYDYLRTQVNRNDVPLLYVLVDENFKVETEADEVIELREDERFNDDFEADDIAVYGILHACMHGGDYSSIVDRPKRSGRKAFQTLATRCARIHDNWESTLQRRACVDLSRVYLPVAEDVPFILPCR